MWQYLLGLLGIGLTQAAPAASAAVGTNLAAYIPDFIEPVVMPMVGAIVQHPYIATSITAASSGLYFYQRSKKSQLQKQHQSNAAVSSAPIALASSSGYRHNCGLHAIAHCWLSQPDNKLRELYAQQPIFQAILHKFYQTYGLIGEPTADALIQINHHFNHPWDRELIWGPVLREVLVDLAIQDCMSGLIDEQELSYLVEHPDCFIQHDMLKVLTERMGATLNVHTSTIAASEYKIHDIEPNVYQYPPREGMATWAMELWYVGDHFEFNFPNKQDNILHNQRKKFSEPARLMDLASLVTRGELISKEKWTDLSQYYTMKGYEIQKAVQSAYHTVQAVQNLLSQTLHRRVM